MPLGYGDALSLIYRQRVVHLCYHEKWHHAPLAVLNQKWAVRSWLIRPDRTAWPTETRRVITPIRIVPSVLPAIKVLFAEGGPDREGQGRCVIHDRNFDMPSDKKMRVVNDAPTVRNLDMRLKRLFWNQCAPRRLSPEAHRHIIMYLAAMAALPLETEQPISPKERPRPVCRTGLNLPTH